MSYIFKFLVYVFIVCSLGTTYAFPRSRYGLEVGVAQLSGAVDHNIVGHVYFISLNLSHVWVWANITGIETNPDGLHGMHVHTYGDISSPTAAYTGSHFIGSGVDIHRCEDSLERHEGDMGNWNVTNGNIQEGKYILDLLSLGGKQSLLGRSVVLHASQDDCLTTSSSLARLAQGVIGVANISNLPSDITSLFPDLGTINYAYQDGEIIIQSTIAVLTPTSTDSNITGIITFEQTEAGGGITIKANEVGDLSSPSDGQYTFPFGAVCTYDSNGTAYYYSYEKYGTLSGSGKLCGSSFSLYTAWFSGTTLNLGDRVAHGVMGLGNNYTYISIPTGVSLESCESQFGAIEVGVAYLEGTQLDSGISGYVYFVKFVDFPRTLIWANISGITLNPNSKHGMHIHKLGDITGPLGLATDSHYSGVNPDGVHSCGLSPDSHEGDMSNWQAKYGNIVEWKEFGLIDVNGPFSIIGRGVILHRDTDDCANTNSSGPRIAQGVIGIANVTALPPFFDALLDLPSTNNNASNGDSTIIKAVVVLTPSSGSNVAGVVTFDQTGTSVLVKARITGLTSGNAYGFHIHNFGDIGGATGLNAGSHFNPYNSNHGLFPSPNRHVGDLGNICSFDTSGTAYFSATYTNSPITLSGINNIVGRAVIIHSIRDNGGDNYGSRIAQGVIGVTVNVTGIVEIPSSVLIATPDCPISTSSTSSTSSTPATSSTTSKQEDPTNKDNGMPLSNGVIAALVIVGLIFAVFLVGTIVYYKRHGHMFWNQGKHDSSQRANGDYVAFNEEDSL